MCELKQAPKLLHYFILKLNYWHNINFLGRFELYD